MTLADKNISIATDIFAKHGDFIYSIISSKTSNKAKINDLYQDFFLSLISNPINPDSKNIKNYLYRAITNDIIDASRRTKRYQKLMYNYTNNLKLTINKTTSKNALNSKDEAEKLLKLAREELSSVEAKAISMKYKDDRSNEEIAESIGVKKESVSRYICVGLKKIRQILAEKRGRNGKD